MRRSLTPGSIRSGTLLLAVGAFAAGAEAGPVVTHPLVSPPTAPRVGRSNPERRDEPAPILPIPLTATEPDGAPIRLTLDDLGYPTGVALEAPGGSASARPIVAPVPTAFGRPPGLRSAEGFSQADRPWLVAAPPLRLSYGSPIAVGARTPIPEPTSVLLLLTGIAGLLARRRLLRERG